jgi:hypothetical protein
MEQVYSVKKLRSGQFEVKWIGGTIETNLSFETARAKFDNLPYELLLAAHRPGRAVQFGAMCQLRGRPTELASGLLGVKCVCDSTDVVAQIAYVSGGKLLNQICCKKCLGLCSMNFFGDQERNLRGRKVSAVHVDDIVGAMDLLDQTYFEERHHHFNVQKPGMANSKWQKFEDYIESLAEADPDAAYGLSYYPNWDQLLDTAGHAGLRTALTRFGNLMVKTTQSVRPDSDNAKARTLKQHADHLAEALSVGFVFKTPSALGARKKMKTEPVLQSLSPNKGYHPEGWCMHYSVLYLVPTIDISPLAPGEFKKKLLAIPSKPGSAGVFFDLLKQTLPETFRSFKRIKGLKKATDKTCWILNRGMSSDPPLRLVIISCDTTYHAVALCSARRVVYDTSNGRECPYGNKRELRAAMAQAGAAHVAALYSYAPGRR